MKARTVVASAFAIGLGFGLAKGLVEQLEFWVRVHFITEQNNRAVAKAEKVQSILRERDQAVRDAERDEARAEHYAGAGGYR